MQELARGLHPAGLTTQGLRPPIERLAATLPVPLEIEALPERRLPEVLEVTVYYFVAEPPPTPRSMRGPAPCAPAWRCAGARSI